MACYGFVGALVWMYRRMNVCVPSFSGHLKVFTLGQGDVEMSSENIHTSPRARSHTPPPLLPKCLLLLKRPNFGGIFYDRKRTSFRIQSPLYVTQHAFDGFSLTALHQTINHFNDNPNQISIEKLPVANITRYDMWNTHQHQSTTLAPLLPIRRAHTHTHFQARTRCAICLKRKKQKKKYKIYDHYT